MRILRGEPLEEAVSVEGASLATARIQAWLYGVCRSYFSLLEQLGQICKTPTTKLDREVLTVLLLGVFQLTQSNAKPYVVVSQSVDAIKRLKKSSAAYLVNAVLRKVDPNFKPKSLSGRTELPAWLVKELQCSYGKDALHQLTQHVNQRMPQCLRVNLAKTTPRQMQALLKENAIDFSTACGGETIFIDTPQPTRSLPGYQEGWFAVQDASAQLPVRHLDLAPGQRVLDACAAPGNKAFQLLEHNISLTALDVNPVRQAWSKTEGKRLGLNLEITEADAQTVAWWDGVPFDRILLDAPCSATGTIGRHPDVKLHRSPDQLPKLQQQQTHLLSNLWQTLAVDGILLYGTCSVLSVENDSVIEHLLKSNSDVVPETLNLPEITGTNAIPQAFGTQILPHPNWGDGFYLAKLRKRALT